MAVIIPENANYLTFYEKVKGTNIKIKSRFKGVKLHVASGPRVPAGKGAPGWIAQLNVGGQTHSGKKQPFTYAGEVQAGKDYKALCEKHGVAYEENQLK